MLSERPSKQTRTTAAAWSFEYWAKGLSQATHRIVGVGWGTSLNLIPAIAQLAEHLTVDSGSDQMVPVRFRVAGRSLPCDSTRPEEPP